MVRQLSTVCQLSMVRQLSRASRRVGFGCFFLACGFVFTTFALPAILVPVTPPRPKPRDFCKRDIRSLLKGGALNARSKSTRAFQVGELPATTWR